jgi:hypothetical protein|tara:strand:+ start:4144 stop:4833 length:690 start_codon:yes stop_codon:yes gene_type:complete
MDYMGMPENTTDLECRICLEADTVENLFTPCKCSGTMKYIHRDCLDEWREKREDANEVDVCELCKYTYNVTAKPTGCFLKVANLPVGPTMLYINILVVILDSVLTRLDTNCIIGNIFNKNAVELSAEYKSYLYMNIYLIAINMVIYIYILLGLLSFKYRRSYLKYWTNKVWKYIIVSYTIVAICIWYEIFWAALALIDLNIYTIIAVHVNSIRRIMNRYNNYIEDYIPV